MLRQRHQGFDNLLHSPASVESTINMYIVDTQHSKPKIHPSLKSLHHLVSTFPFRARREPVDLFDERHPKITPDATKRDFDVH